MTPAARGAGVLELHLHRGGALPQVPDIRGDADGSLRPPTTMWVVGHDADLYVRSVNGPDGTWYRRALEQREGHIHAGSVDKDVTFAPPDHAIDDIDAAYRRRYRRYAANIIDAITSTQARAATLRLVPKE